MQQRESRISFLGGNPEARGPQWGLFMRLNANDFGSEEIMNDVLGAMDPIELAAYIQSCPEADREKNLRDFHEKMDEIKQRAQILTANGGARTLESELKGRIQEICRIVDGTPLPVKEGIRRAVSHLRIRAGNFFNIP